MQLQLLILFWSRSSGRLHGSRDTRCSRGGASHPCSGTHHTAPTQLGPTAKVDMAGPSSPGLLARAVHIPAAYRILVTQLPAWIRTTWVQHACSTWSNKQRVLCSASSTRGPNAITQSCLCVTTYCTCQASWVTASLLAHQYHILPGCPLARCMPAPVNSF